MTSKIAWRVREGGRVHTHPSRAEAEAAVVRKTADG